MEKLTLKNSPTISIDAAVNKIKERKNTVYKPNQKLKRKPHKHKTYNDENKEIFVFPIYSKSTKMRGKKLFNEIMRLQIRCAMLASKVNSILEEFLTPDQLESIQTKFEQEFEQYYKEARAKIKQHLTEFRKNYDTNVQKKRNKHNNQKNISQEIQAEKQENNNN